MLDGVWDATRLPDGRIVLADLGSSEIRVFDAAGTHLNSWGREGEGPGEFQGLLAVERWPGDSIAAWYGPRRGISVFDAEGNFGRNFTLERNPDDPNAILVRPAAVRADGTILAGHDPHALDRVAVEIRDGEGSMLSSLGEHPGWELDLIFPAVVAEAPWGDLIVHGLNNRYEIRAFAEDGTLARIVRWDGVPRSPTQADIEAYIKDRVSIYPVNLTPGEIEEYQAEKRREWQSTPVAEHMPVFSAVKADALNYLWVEVYQLPGEERPGSLWTVVDPEGRGLGYVELPAEGQWIYEIGEDYVLVRSWDELDVERVQLWSLER